MSRTEINHIVFCPKNYKYDTHDYNDCCDEEAMYKDIGDMLKLLIKQGYQCHVWSDSYCTAITFDYADEELAKNCLRWMSSQEADEYDAWCWCRDAEDEDSDCGGSDTYDIAVTPAPWEDDE